MSGWPGNNAVLCGMAKPRYNMTMVSDHGRVVMKSTVAAGEFKAKCLKMLDEVAEKRLTLVITKRGKPVAQMVPVPTKQRDIVGSMKGSVTILGDIISPLDVE